MAPPEFILNTNPGKDVIHVVAGLTESCNTDDAIGKQRIDRATAEALLRRGAAERCKHCNRETP